MIRFEFRTDDCDPSAKNYPDIEMTLDGDGYNVAYLVNMFRQFLLAMSFTENTINDYMTDPMENGIENHIEDRMKEKFNEFLEKKAKVSEESADNYGLSKNEKPVKDWTIEDWRAEFKCWMKSESGDMFIEYEVVSGNHRPVNTIGDHKEFISEAFRWNNTFLFSKTDWENLNQDWEGYITSLEGEG